MAEFGEDFDLDVFEEAYREDDPVRLNQVKAVERGVDQLYNYIAELAAFLLKNAPAEQLVEAIRIVAAGDSLLAPSVTRPVIEEFVRSP